VSAVPIAPIAELTDEDLLFDLDLRVVPLDPSTSEPTAGVHTSYVTEGCTKYPRCTYGCSYTCRSHAAHEQNMCL
jgi:hypothetical protein